VNRVKKINWRLIVGLVFSAIALWLILKDVNLNDLLAELLKANYWWMLPSLLIQLAGMWVRAVRWRALLDKRVPTGRAFHISNIGQLLNNVLPLRLGELSKAYLASHGSSVTVMQSLSTVLIERLLDVLSVFVFLILVLPLVPSDSLLRNAGQATAMFAVAAIVGLFVAAAWRERTISLAQALTGWLKPAWRAGLLHWGDDFLRGVNSAGGRRLAAAIFWSLIIWVCWTLSAYMLLLGFVNLPLHAGVYLTCALALGLTIPSAPSGAGLYEAAAVVALAAFDVPTSLALAYAVAAHISTFLFNALFGIIGLDREGESFGHIAASAQSLTTSTEKQ
jgi:hypothetical protein